MNRSVNVEGCVIGVSSKDKEHEILIEMKTNRRNSLVCC